MPVINKAVSLNAQDYSAVQPRAIGDARLVVHAAQEGATAIKDLRQSGSLKLAFPRGEGQGIEAVLVNTAGGLTGGDRLTLDLGVQRDAGLTLTTQAAERAYRAQNGEVATFSTRIRVESGARMNWMPQELILFDRSALHRRLEIHLAENAELLMVEPIAFGRAAMGERLRDIQFRDRIKITRGDGPLYLDGLDLTGDVASHLARPAIANRAGAMASVLAVAPNVACRLDALRAMLPNTGGASLLAPDVLILRLLGADSFELRRSLIPVLEHLKQGPLPKSWRL